MKYRFKAGRLTSRTGKRAERTAGWESQVTRDQPTGPERNSIPDERGPERSEDHREEGFLCSGAEPILILSGTR